MVSKVAPPPWWLTTFRADALKIKKDGHPLTKLSRGGWTNVLGISDPESQGSAQSISSTGFACPRSI